MKNNNKENNSKIKITDLSNKITNSDLEDLSNSKTAEIVGGTWYSSTFGVYRRAIVGIGGGRSPIIFWAILSSLQLIQHLQSFQFFSIG